MNQNKKLLIMTSILLVMTLLATACGGGGAAAPDGGGGGGGSRADMTFEDAPIKWTMQSIWAPSITLWRGDKYIVDAINRMALGELYIEYNPGGALVTTSDELFDAISTGALDMGTDWPSYWEGRNTAFTLITSTPMVLTPGDYMLWYWQAGGLELAQQLYDKYNIVWYPHSVTGAESGQRTNVPISELDDYSGLKLRQCGRTQALILEKMGAGAIFMPGADIYLSLDRGVIDGGEFSVPECDWNMAFQEVTKYNVTPGWHQPGPISGIMINKDSFNALPDHVKYLFKEAAMSSMMWSWTYFEYSTIQYNQKFKDAGTQISRLSDDALSQIQQIAWDQLLEDARENPDHARIAFSQVKYLYEFQEPRDMQAPFTFGRNPEGLNEVYAELEQIAKDHGVYQDVIDIEASLRERMEAQEQWEPGTPYVLNPIAQ